MLLENKIIKNSSWDVFQQLYSSILAFVVGIVSARVLGPSNYGIIGIVNAVMLFVSAVSWLGLDSIFALAVVSDPQKEETIVGTTLVVKIVITLACLPIAFFVVDSVYNEKAITIVFVIVSFSMVFQIYEIIRWWLQCKYETKYYSLVMICVSTIMTVFQLFLILSKKNVYWFATVQGIQNFLLSVCLICIYFKHFKNKMCFSIDILKSMLKNSYHYIISALSITVYMQIDKIMIGKMLSEHAAGCYNAAVNISVLWQFVPISIINAIRPFLFKCNQEKGTKFIDYYKKMVFVIVLVSFAISTVITLFSPQIITMLYGSDYYEAIVPLRICTWATFFSMIGVMRSIWILANNYNRYDKYFTVIAAVINVVLNYYGIIHFGIVGAAISTLVSYFVEVLVVNVMFKDTRCFNRLFFEALTEIKDSISIIKSILKKAE